VLKNNYVQDGKMYQCGVETDDAYYGGMFVTIDKMEYLYGHLELSTLHPRGLGFWTALWTQSSSSGNNEIPANERLYFIEVDVEECYGNGGDWAYGNTFAWPTALGRQQLGLPDKGGTVHVNNRVNAADERGFWLDFHTFGYEWVDNTHVRFTCDGYVYKDQELKDPAEMHAFLQPTYLRLSMACGAGSHGQPTTDPDAWKNTNKFIVDWVHIYQKAGQKIFQKEKGKWVEYIR
jgi:beta-glucanase (GH16 family)